jgi:hypothetical protein
MVRVESPLPIGIDAHRDPSPVVAGLARAGVAFAIVDVAIAAMGAFVARPIADDLVVNAKVVHLHGALPAFGSWMTSWTGYYSEYGILTAIAGLTRTVGLDRFTFSIASVGFMALVVAAVRACVVASRRLGVTDWDWPESALLTAGLLGSFVGPLKESLRTNLYEAIYWASAYMSHLVPVVACPLVIITLLRFRNRVVRAGCAFGGGVLIAGFGMVETIVVTAIVGAVAWVASRLRGRHAISQQRSTLTAASLGLIAGTVLVELMPGTAARAQFLESIHRGLTTHRGFANLTRAAGSIAGSDAKAVLLSPAPVLGLFIGLGLYLAPLSRTRAELAGALPVLLKAAWAVVLVTWAAVTVGDVCSYQASWHLLPLAAVFYVACFLTGYALGTLSSARYVPVAVCGCLVATLAWTTMQTTVAADTAFARARVFDANIRSVQIALAHTPPRPAIWNSMSVGPMTDAAASGPNVFAANAVSQWLGIPPSQLVIVPVSAPLARFF